MMKQKIVKFLELKCPPPLVMLIAAIVALGLSQRGLDFIQQQLGSIELVIWPLAFFITGVALAVAGVKEFSQHQTTISPIQPENSTSLVTSGIYQFTRNPMYLGMLIMLLGWADLLDSFSAYSGALFFFVYISAFQIKPEEEIMKQKFDQQFQQYCMQVRRWL